MKKDEFIAFINEIDNDNLFEVISSLPGSVEHGTITDVFKYIDNDFDTEREKQELLNRYGGDEKEMYMDFAKCYASLVHDAIIEYAKRTLDSTEEDEYRDPMLDYVKENLESWEIEQAWDCIGNHQPIPTTLADKIYDLCEEYSAMNNYPECSWGEQYEDAEEVFRAL